MGQRILNKKIHARSSKPIQVRKKLTIMTKKSTIAFDATYNFYNSKFTLKYVTGTERESNQHVFDIASWPFYLVIRRALVYYTNA